MGRLGECAKFVAFTVSSVTLIWSIAAIMWLVEGGWRKREP